MKRREFLAASAGCACALLTPARSAAPPLKATTGPVKIGALASFTKEGLDTHFLQDGFFVVRIKDRLYALSAFCTHQANNLLNGKSGGEKIICPNHGSQFALDGSVQRGPARRNLSRLAITVDAQGQVTVDTSKTIPPDNAEDAAAFVKIG